MKSRYRWFLMAGINLLIVVNTLILCFVYIKRVEAEQSEMNIAAFSETVYSVEKAAYGYLMEHQEVCDSWAGYINSKKLTVAETLDYLTYSNSNNNIMAQFISATTFKGYSTVKDENGSNIVDYNHISSVSKTLARLTKLHDSDIYVTSMYTNPVNAMNVVAFAADIYIDVDGNLEEYYLLRIVPEQDIKSAWVFTEEYKDAELSLIDENGDYIVRSSSLKNQNVWEYLRIYNNLTYEESDRLAADLKEKRETYVEKNSEGKDCYFICESFDQKGYWYFIGYMPVASLVKPKVDITLIFYISAGFLLVMFVNISQLFKANKKLVKAIKEKEKANVAKTLFLSSMSHDIRTPMNAIVGMTAIATKHIDNKEYVKECLRKVSLASNHLLTLINDILDINKIETGKMSINPTAFSLSEMVANLANIVRNNIDSKNISFEIHVHNVEYENLFADELRLNQIYINILSNAVKYTDCNGKITMDIEERMIEDDPENLELIYRVEDNGIGMSKEFQKNMYDSFTRAVDTRIDKIEGTGLGLAITKQMVDLMNGSIECQSEEGVGTTFTISIKVGITKKEEAFVLPDMKLLIVDDDPIFLETASDMFKNMNAVADVADSGKKAVEMVSGRHNEGNDYPMVIVDLKMPDMDGIETTKAIRKEVGDDVPIIIVSAYEMQDISEIVDKAGANGVISKPLFKSTIYYKLNEFLHFDKSANAKKDDEDYSALAGLRILVAEDNDFNWEIAEELLETYEIKSDRAINGAVCVDMLSRSPANTYDAILMDVQMPVMNGKEAAIAIRGMMDENKKNIPIIALTADAFSEDIKSCLDAGMNGHVSKPVKKEKLLYELIKTGVIKKER